jgi:hypothetical protein
VLLRKFQKKKRNPPQESFPKDSSLFVNSLHWALSTSCWLPPWLVVCRQQAVTVTGGGGGGDW